MFLSFIERREATFKSSREWWKQVKNTNKSHHFMKIRLKMAKIGLWKWWLAWAHSNDSHFIGIVSFCWLVNISTTERTRNYVLLCLCSLSHSISVPTFKSLILWPPRSKYRMIQYSIYIGLYIPSTVLLTNYLIPFFHWPYVLVWLI